MYYRHPVRKGRKRGKDNAIKGGPPRDPKTGNYLPDPMPKENILPLEPWKVQGVRAHTRKEQLLTKKVILKGG